MANLEALIYKLIHRGKKDINELSELLAVSVNYLYKMASPPGTSSYSDIGLRRLIAIMKAQKDDDIIRYLCSRFGGLFIKVPRVARDKRDWNCIINKYQSLVNRVVELLLTYSEAPSKELQEKLLELLTQAAAQNIGIRKKVEKDGQFDLFENEQL